MEGKPVKWSRSYRGGGHLDLLTGLSFFVCLDHADCYIHENGGHYHKSRSPHSNGLRDSASAISLRS